MEHLPPHGFTLPTNTFVSTDPSLPLEEYRELRWYDKDVFTAKAVQTLLTFPNALQNMVCQTVLTLLAQQPEGKNAAVHRSSVDTILKTYRTHQQQRPTHQRELTHSTLIILGQLPDPLQKRMVQTIHQLNTAFKDYLKLCKQYQAHPNLTEARHLLAQYLSSGVSGYQQGLGHMAQQYAQRHQSKTQQQLYRSALTPPQHPPLLQDTAYFKSSFVYKKTPSLYKQPSR